MEKDAESEDSCWSSEPPAKDELSSRSRSRPVAQTEPRDLWYPEELQSSKPLDVVDLILLFRLSFCLFLKLCPYGPEAKSRPSTTMADSRCLLTECQLPESEPAATFWQTTSTVNTKYIYSSTAVVIAV